MRRCSGTPKWQVGKPLATASRASCAGLLRVDPCLGRCCAAPPSPSPRRLRQLLSRHRRQGGPSPPPDPPPLPSPALPSPSPPPRKRSGRTTEMLLVECAHRKASEVRVSSVARMQPGCCCRVACLLNKYVLNKKYSAMLRLRRLSSYAGGRLPGLSD